jgi:O-acetylhomoserine/O-acetylserine sulfhydrylase-like pyridoxal-dependent enzyme
MPNERTPKKPREQYRLRTRLSLGLEDCHDIIADLEDALEVV